MTLYDLLEIPTNASDKEIKNAYKKMARRYHPDINKDGQAMFVRINNAYAILSDSRQKAKYDTMLSSSTARTFEIFTSGAANPDTYYSPSDLWHQSFMRNNTPTKEWNFDVPEENQSFNQVYQQSNYSQNDNYFYQEHSRTNFHPNDIMTINGLEAFLDKDISLAFHQIFKTNNIESNLFERLLHKKEIVNNNINASNLVEFIKFKYDYNSWVKNKNYLDIELILEVTLDEIYSGAQIKVPLKIKAINEQQIYDVWHEEPRNYVFNLPKTTKNGEVIEFFNKGHKALGWQGDLIVTVRVVKSVSQRICVFKGQFDNDRTSLWFVLNSYDGMPGKKDF